MVKYIKNPCNIYTLGWCCYYLQGTLYSYGSPIAKVILLLLLLYSICIVIQNRFFNSENVYFKGLNTVFSLFCLYGVFTFFIWGAEINQIHQSAFDLVKPSLISILPIYVYYHFSVKGYINEKWLGNWIFLFVVVAICSFYREQNDRLRLISELGSRREEVTNNTGYLFVSIIPMLFFTRRNIWIQFGLLSILLLFVVFAMKRGAIIVGMISAILFVYFSIKRKKSVYKFGVILLVFALLVFLYFRLESFLIQSDYFNARLQQTLDGDSSGRDVMYNQMFDYFLNQTSSISFFFGRGLGGTLSIFGNGAHNDWLEFAIDMGLIGIIIYLLYWIKFVYVWIKTKFNIQVKFALGVIIISEFLKTFFSFSINNLPLYEVITLAYCLFLIRKSNKYEFSNCR